jgi:hypothetical protein
MDSVDESPAERVAAVALRTGEDMGSGFQKQG